MRGAIPLLPLYACIATFTFTSDFHFYSICICILLSFLSQTNTQATQISKLRYYLDYVVNKDNGVTA